MEQTVHKRTPKKAALASWIGSVVEYYDFFIYGTAAALVFKHIFFPPGNERAALIGSFATFGVAYVARPFGALLFGHIGDRFGRKRVMTISLLMMGLSTLMIGFLPTYETVGLWAPVMLVIARLMQGISAGGEQAGANSMVLEHSPQNRRGFYTSFTLSGTQAGLILATFVFVPFETFMPDAFLDWGWRVPFWLSAIVVVVGFWVRRTLSETPVFMEDRKTAQKEKSPITELLRNDWRDVVRVIFCSMVAVISTIFALFTLSYAVEVHQIAKNDMLMLVVAANVVALGAIPAWAALSDRIGRKPVFVIGAVSCAILIWPYIWSIGQGNMTLTVILGIIFSGVAYSAANGVWPAFYSEMFTSKVRMSGTAIGTQIGFALCGFAPTIAQLILGEGPNGWMPVAIFTSATALIAAIAALTARETAHIPTEELGLKKQG